MLASAPPVILHSVFTPLSAVVVGALIGLAGVGGVFLIPVLLLVEGRSIHQIVGTVLVAFACSQVVGVVLYARRGVIDWPTTFWLCAGTIPLGPLGARLSVSLPPEVVHAVLAAFLVLAGARVVWETLQPATHTSAPAAKRPLPRALLVAGGALVGFAAGLLGVGGPVLLVPLLLLFGMPVVNTVGVSQVIGLVGSVAGAAGHLAFGEVDLPLAALLAVCTMLGIYGGARLSRHVPPGPLRVLVGVLCLAFGPVILVTPGR